MLPHSQPHKHAQLNVPGAGAHSDLGHAFRPLPPLRVHRGVAVPAHTSSRRRAARRFTANMASMLASSQNCHIWRRWIWGCARYQLKNAPRKRGWCGELDTCMRSTRHRHAVQVTAASAGDPRMRGAACACSRAVPAAGTRHRRIARMQTENMHMRIFRKLKMSPEQCSQMAACWHTWLARRRALNATVDSAQQLLNTLPKTLDIPLDHLSHISQIAADPQTVCTNCARSASATAQLAMHEGHECSGTCSAGPADGGRRSERVKRACEVCGAVMDTTEVGENEPGGMLGADHGSTCRAAEALRQLWRMLDADASLAVSVMALQRQPGGILGAWQLTLECQTNMEHGNAPIDRLVLCQLAAAQERRQELLRWPAVLVNPLPVHI